MKQIAEIPVKVRDKSGNVMTVAKFHGQVVVTTCGQKHYISSLKRVFQIEHEMNAAIQRVEALIDRRTLEAHKGVARDVERAVQEIKQYRRASAAKHARAAKGAQHERA